MKVAIFARNVNEKWLDRVCSIIEDLLKKGVEIICYRAFYNRIEKRCKIKDLHCNLFLEDSLFSGASDLPDDTDILLSLGGDGTFLESVSVIGDKKIRIAGINFGRLGFLTSVDSWSHTGWIEKLASGEYTTRKRSLLAASYSDTPDVFLGYALNEVLFHRSGPSMIALHVTVNGTNLPVYWADGLILATTTGSTAYSLSVGGPIALPDVKATILAPIAPHNLNVRPLIIPEDFTVEIFVESRSGRAVLSIDNRSVYIAEKTKVTISKANHQIEYILFNSGSDSFIAALEEKLMWGKDRRNN